MTEDKTKSLPSEVLGHMTAPQLAQHEACSGGPVLLAERYQDNVMTWAVACFGQTTAEDKQERVFRFFEEAAELAQAAGMTQAEGADLLAYVYDRPEGEPSQEVGGVMVTLAALCAAFGLDLQRSANAELARVWGKIEKIRAKHESKPQYVKTPLPGLAFQEYQQAPEPFVRLDIPAGGLVTMTVNGVTHPLVNQAGVYVVKDMTQAERSEVIDRLLGQRVLADTLSPVLDDLADLWVRGLLEAQRAAAWQAAGCIIEGFGPAIAQSLDRVALADRLLDQMTEGHD